MAPETDLTERQRREREYHREFAAKHAALISEPPNTDVIFNQERRWWNAHWSMYDLILAAELSGKKVLIPGCGFGSDAMLLRTLGADVFGFDISREIIEIARLRAANYGMADIDFQVMVAEKLVYPDDTFDAVIFVNILHHVEIAIAMAEVTRVLRPGGLIIGNELYTHSSLQRIRESIFVNGWLYPRMRRWIYGNDTPYITEDERKINESEFALVSARLTDARIAYFAFLEGRIFPGHMAWASRLDRRFLRLVRPIGPLLGSRVMFLGHARK
ncbi:MAG: class I SAM-dependent methyltransferase [Rhodocyclaceae bacterium]|nr:class I SAM-dependent methyltransferase [Rhodocyclaceae bacterium]